MIDSSNEDELDRLAREELTKEAKRGAERAKELGAFGWVKPSGASTDKKFLGNVLVSTLRSNKRRKHSHDHDERSRRHKKRRYSREDRHSPPKLINGGHFRYNDNRKYSVESQSKERKKDNKSPEINDPDDKQSSYKNGYVQPEMQNEEMLTKEVTGLDKGKRHVNKKHKGPDDSQHLSKGDNLLNPIEVPVIEAKREKRKSLDRTEDSLIEDIPKQKTLEETGDNIIDFVGDYLIDKHRKKKQKDKKSHKSKHKHKKHKHKSKKNSV